MADIRCSNCQTLNPADAKVCKNCGRPLLDESPNWLDNLRSDSGSSSWSESETNAKAAEESQPNEEIPDWLQRIRQRNQEEQSRPGPFSSAGESEEETPDWLKSLTASSSTGSEDTGEADWLQNLRGSQPSSSPESNSGIFEEGIQPLDAGDSAETPQETPDWLRNIASWNDEPTDQEEIQPVENPFDVSAEQKGDQPIAEFHTSGEENDEEWLSNLAAQAGSASTPLDENADWLASFQAGTTPDESVPPLPHTGVTDWLSSLSEENESAAASGSEIKKPISTPEEKAPAGAFSWESEPSSDEPIIGQEAESPYTIPEETPTSGSFSWESESSSKEPISGQSDETPDWLRQFDLQDVPGQQPLQESAQSRAFESDDAGEKLPDWMGTYASFESEAPASEEAQSEPAAEAAEPISEEGIPDWLKNFTPSETPLPAEEPVVPISEEPQEESFSWQSLGIPADDTKLAAEEAVEAPPFAAANLPEWLDQSGIGTPRLDFDQDLIPPAEPSGEHQPVTPFSQTGLPEWLDESGVSLPASESEGVELPEEISDQNLEAAELPSWLQSMRPIEMVAPKAASADDKRTEKAGPLAGLAGVLPSEDLVGQYIKPPLYSVKLRVSEKQRVHASLIETLISEESQPQAIPPERSEAPQRVLRFLVAAILILAILLPRFNFLPALPSATILPQELIAFEATLADESLLPRGSAVLLALEYEPGLSGEMQTASEGVIRQLAEKDIRLTIISTSPSGPILAEALLKKAAFDPAFRVNLGYLAGGSTGLQSFGLAPMQAAPATLQGQLAPWNSGVLAGISRLSDFSAAIVLTDDPDKGRNWVEQVQPSLGGKPLLIVSSAQAAPLLLPYYNSGQVQGIISGITGAAGFETLTQSSGSATLLRDAYQYGMMLTALLILVGSLITGIITSITRSKAEKEV